AVNGRIAGRQGNRDPYAAPHGVYPCRGAGRWVAIAVTTEEEWRAFCRVIGEPAWTRDTRFATLLGRKQNEDDLDELISAWSSGYLAEEIMTMMQGQGVPAGVSQTCEDLLEYDPQLKHRGHFVQLKHKVMGSHAYRAPAYKLSRTPAHLYKAAPALGEDNEYVYKEVLGYSDAEVADLLVHGVITTEYDMPAGV
ncbi:MAG: CoA transferase, partial [Lentisphaerota bacterium]